MEECVNKRLNVMSIPYFAKLMAEFRQAQTDIADLKRATTTAAHF